MKKGYIFIYAYIAGNLGDDLMVRCLCERYPRSSSCFVPTDIMQGHSGILRI